MSGADLGKVQQPLIITDPSNGRKGHIQYRDFSIHDLFQKHEYEDVVHLLVWGHLPSAEEKATFRRALAAEMTKIPKSVMDTIRALP